MKVKIYESKSIPICGDMCCNADGFYIENSKGITETFVTDMSMELLVLLIKHLLPDVIIEQFPKAPTDHYSP